MYASASKCVELMNVNTIRQQFKEVPQPYSDQRNNSPVIVLTKSIVVLRVRDTRRSQIFAKHKSDV